MAKETAITNGINPDLLMVKTDPYCGKKTVSGGNKRAEDYEKEIADLKNKLKEKNQQPQGYGHRFAGRGGRGRNGGRPLNDPSTRERGDVSELTKRKMSETCTIYNSGGSCDSSCGLKHLCSNVLRPGHLCWRPHAAYAHTE